MTAPASPLHHVLGSLLADLAQAPSQDTLLGLLCSRLRSALGWRAHVVSGALLTPAAPGTLPLPLPGRGGVLATLCVAQLTPDQGDRAALELFASAIGAVLGQVERREQAERVSELAEQLLVQEDARAATEGVLRLLHGEFAPGGITLLYHRQGQLVPDPRLRAGTPEWPSAWGCGPEGGQLSSLMVTGDPHALPGGLLVPIRGRLRARSAFWLAAGEERVWSDEELRAVRRIVRRLGLEFEHLGAQARLTSLLSLQRQLLSVAAEDLYQPLLEEAVRLVPGAEAGSLLLRREDRFYYRGVVGYDAAELAGVSFLVTDSRDRWYGIGEDAWNRGLPRLISRAGMQEQGVGYQLQGLRVEDVLPSILPVQASIAVPILYEGEVYALINIDTHSDAHAFDADAVEVARTFGIQAAVLIHEARRKHQIEAAARTDALTGLGNRRAFNEQLARQVANARRHGHALALLVIDLRGFKGINDQLGHAAGDEALARVARLLEQTVREGDEPFRWGGDEFAVLLPYTDAPGAGRVAGRFAAAMAEQEIGGLPLRANIGLASSGGDVDGEALLREADAAMYRAKQGGRSIGD